MTVGAEAQRREAGLAPPPRGLALVVGFVYGWLTLLVAMVLALGLGTLAVLPFVVVPRGRRERFTMRAAVLWAWAVVRGLLLVRPRVTGEVRLPGRGGALFLCNHRSWLDPLLMIACTRSQGLSKMSVFWIPFVGIYGWLTGAVFFDRRSPRQRQRAREEVMSLVRGGHRIHVFPEGTRTRTGALREKVFLTLPRDCYEAGLPVVPCAVMGTEAILPTGLPVALPGRSCRLDIGEPLFPEDHPDAESFAKACWAEVQRRVSLLEGER